MANLGKSDVIQAVADKVGKSKIEVAATLNALEEVVTETVKKGGSVILTGFVSFKTQTQAARSGVAMGRKWTRPAGKVIKAKVGNKLKNAV
ncbi:MAG: HU family DNA-binding protein [Bifidobacteriaceae bacterium]|jgi:DNA-binding protein HU-beta|nr:HU family DNA-binding protein [Bifidobacteriaceae bacterium]